MTCFELCAIVQGGDTIASRQVSSMNKILLRVEKGEYLRFEMSALTQCREAESSRFFRVLSGTVRIITTYFNQGVHRVFLNLIYERR